MRADVGSEAWVLFVDVYGFTSMTMSVSSERLAKKLRRVERALTSNIRFGRTKPLLYWFSDSLFCVYPSKDNLRESTELLKQITIDVLILYQAYAQEDLPLRGGAAFGKVTAEGRRVVGAPVIRAVSYEKLIELPFVLVPAGELRKPQDDYEFITPLERVELRNGDVMLGKLIVPGAREHYRELALNQYRKTLIEGPYNVARVWERTLQRIDNGPDHIKIGSRNA